MAAEKIQSGKVEIALLETVTTGVTCYGRVVKDPTTKTVRLYMVARSSSNITPTTVMAIVPEGFRPTGNEALYGTMMTSGNTIAAYYAILKSDGTVTQSLGSAIREVAVSGEYPIA